MVGDILQPTHLLFVLVIALLVLGPKRLPEVAKTLGKGIRDFRGAISGDSDHHDGSLPSFLTHDSESESDHAVPAASAAQPAPTDAAPSGAASAPQPAPADAPQPAATQPPQPLPTGAAPQPMPATAAPEPAMPAGPPSDAPADPQPRVPTTQVQPIATPATVAPLPPAAPAPASSGHEADERGSSSERHE